MATQRLTFLIPPYGTATLTLPELLTTEAFARLESAIGSVLGEPRQDFGAAAALDPASIEVDSWSIPRH